MDGILNVNKPGGPTSHDIVARVRALLPTHRVGHGGTLDPLASGVLPLFLGQATRLAEHLLEFHKTYRATLELGVSTDTYDAEGQVVGRGDASSVTQEALAEALDAFRGTIQQTPPLYSGVKQRGEPLYRMARRGAAIEVKSRSVHIYRLEAVSFEPPLVTLEIECGRGTYIRSLAHDLGERLGCGAYLKALVRTGYGPFDISSAVFMPQLESAIRDGSWPALVYPMDYILSGWLALTLDNERAAAIRHGSSLSLLAPPGEERLRAYDQNGCLLALLRYDAGTGLWRPRKVFGSPNS